MSLDAYADFIYRAGWLHLDDPAAAWRTYATRLRALSDLISEARTLRVVAEDTDLSVGVGGRTWIASRGERNFPDGEIFTGPIETETTGDVRFSFPAVMGGREVQDVRLRFDGGVVLLAALGLFAAERGRQLGCDVGMPDDLEVRPAVRRAVHLQH